MKRHRGRSDVQRTLSSLQTLARECERRAAAQPNQLMKQLALHSREIERKLATADQHKQWALAELKRADQSLEQVYEEGLARNDQLCAAIVALYGHDPQQLAAFGLAVRRSRGRIAWRLAAPSRPVLEEPASEQAPANGQAPGSAGPAATEAFVAALNGAPASPVAESPAAGPAQPPAVEPAKEDAR